MDKNGTGESFQVNLTFNKSENDDPLLEEKRYLVTMIYTNFTQLNKAVTTTKEFYRIGNILG